MPTRSRRKNGDGPEPLRDNLEDLRGLPLFASVVAHEIRNPLSAVKIALQTVERQSQIPANDSTRLRIALREVATIEKVLSQVLEWARPGALHPEKVLASTLIETALKQVQPELAERRIEVMWARDESFTVSVDPLRGAHALAELLRNAIDGSPVGGAVTITTTRSDKSLLIGIDNDGALTAEDCKRAFDPFFTRRARGIGLGLPRARSIARGSNGDATLETREGGARACLMLPEAD